MSTELAFYGKINDPINAVEKLGAWFARSGMFGCDKPEQGAVLALHCMCTQKSPVEISSRYHILEGTLQKKAVAILAEFRMAGGRHKWIRTGDDGLVAELELTAKDGSAITTKYTIEQARQSGLVRDKSNWVKNPGDMLRARAITKAVKMLCPELIIDANVSDEEIVAADPLAFVGQSTPPANTTPAPAPTTKAAEPTIDVPSEVIPPAPAPIPEPTPATPPSPELAYLDQATGLLSAASQAKILSIIGDKETEVFQWMIHRQWLKEGQTLANLSLPRAQKIIGKPTEFLSVVAKSTPATTATATA